MERNERLKAADKCASKYTNENEAHIARAAFMLGCEFEAHGEVVKGVVLETEDEHWKPSEEQMKEYSYWYRNFIESGLASPTSKAVTVLGELLEQLKKLM